MLTFIMSSMLYTNGVYKSLAKVTQTMPFLEASLIFFDVTDDEEGGKAQLKSGYARVLNKLSGTSTAASPIVMGEVIASQVGGSSGSAGTARDFMEKKVGAAEAELDGLFTAINLRMTMLLARNSMRTSVEKTWWAQAYKMTSTDSGPATMYRGYAKRALGSTTIERAVNTVFRGSAQDGIATRRDTEAREGHATLAQGTLAQGKTVLDFSNV